MASPARDLIVNLVGRTNQLMGPLEGASAQMSQLGGTLTRTLTPAAAAVGAGFAVAGRDFNEGRNAIITATGAAGADLNEFQSIMGSIGGKVPQDLGAIGAAIGEVNTRLGLTGPELESMSTQMLNLSRVTGSDVVSTVANTTRVFGDWSIATADQSRALDVIFEATKRTGIGMDRLTTLTVQYGAPLRQLGFGFEESTALLSKFEREGVNTETVVGGLRQALGKMARAGEDPIETFTRVTDEIANAGSAGEANAIALDLFGQRAGPDMAAAIREGRFEIGDLVDQLGDSEGSLEDVADRTLTLSDKFSMFKNRLTATLGPFGEFGAVAGGVLASIGPVLLGLGQLGPLLGTVGTAFTKLSLLLMANPFVALAAALIAIGVLIFFHRDKVLGALTAAWEWVKGVTETVWNAIKGFFERFWPALLVIFTGGAAALPLLIIRYWDDITRITGDLIDAVVDFFTKLPGRIVSGIESAVGAVLDWFGGLVGRVLGMIGDGLTALFDVGVDFIVGLLNGYKNAWVQVYLWVRDIPNKILAMIGDGLLILVDVGKDIIQGLWNGLKEKWDSVAGWFGDRIADIGGFFTSAFGISSPSKVFAGFGRDMMKGLELGLSGGATSADRTLGRIMDGMQPGSPAAFRRGGGGYGAPIRIQVVMPNGQVLAEAVAEANLASGGQYQ